MTAGILFVGEIAIEPHRHGAGGILRKIDELLALEGRKIEDLGFARRRRQQAGRDSDDVCNSFEHALPGKCENRTGARPIDLKDLRLRPQALPRQC